MGELRLVCKEDDDVISEWSGPLVFGLSVGLNNTWGLRFFQLNRSYTVLIGALVVVVTL